MELSFYLALSIVSFVVYRVEIDFPFLIFLFPRLPYLAYIFFISFPIFHSQFQLAASRCPIRAFNGKQVRREWNLCYLFFYFGYRANFIEGKNELFTQPDGSLDWDVQSIGTEFFYSSFF